MLSLWQFFSYSLSVPTKILVPTMVFAPETLIW